MVERGPAPYVTRPASYPDVSLDENVRAKKDGKETYVPYPWSPAVHHRSVAFRARLYHAKNEAPKEEAVTRPRVDIFPESCYF